MTLPHARVRNVDVQKFSWTFVCIIMGFYNPMKTRLNLFATMSTCRIRIWLRFDHTHKARLPLVTRAIVKKHQPCTTNVLQDLVGISLVHSCTPYKISCRNSGTLARLVLSARIFVALLQEPAICAKYTGKKYSKVNSCKGVWICCEIGQFPTVSQSVKPNSKCNNSNG